MSKKKEPSAVHTFDLSLLIEWIQTYGKTLLLSFIVALVLIVILIRFSFGTSSSSEDFREVEKAFALFSSDPTDTNALSTLENILSVHPELKAKYDGVMAQILLSRSVTKEAIPFAKAAINLADKEHLTDFTTFSKANLTLSEGSFEKAYSSLTELKHTLLKKESLNETEKTLLGFTLIESAFLLEKLGQREEENKTWNEVLNLPPATFKKLEAIFTEGRITLTQYIQSRQN